MSKYIVGIDGGGTSTDGVLFDLEGNHIRTYQTGFANFRVHPAIAKDNVITTIERLIDGISKEDILSIQIGLAGIPNETDRVALEEELSNTYLTSVSIVTDALIALFSIRQNDPGCLLMILGGTGSVILIGNDNHVERIGGYGHLLGDKGSAYHVSITALERVIEQFEHGDKITSLSLAILQNINAEGPSDIKDFVYSHSKQEIAQLSKFLATHAEQGDKEAIALFQEEGVHLAKQAILAYRKLSVCDHVTIGLRGSFLLKAPYVKEALFSYLNQQEISYSVDDRRVEPVEGAFYLGLSQLQKR